MLLASSNQPARMARVWENSEPTEPIAKQILSWTVRQWKLQFSGAEGSNIEEFIEHVSECRALAPYITDEDLLNATTELMSCVARHCCRQERQKCQSWQDFCEDAHRCYGVDKRFQRRLRKEAESRTQVRDEPVRDYIVCLRAILNKFDRPWTGEWQLALLYDNILPRLQFKVRQEEVTSINKLIELVREAEAELEVEQNFKEQPNPKWCIMPEVAYQSPTIPAKPPLPRNKSSLVAIAESANSHNKSFEADDTAQKTSLAAVAAQSPADLS